MKKQNKVPVFGTVLGKILAVFLIITFILADIALIKWLFNYIL